MKRSLRIVGAALMVLGIFAGMASAESPDACSSFGCAKSFSAQNNAYTYVDGVLESAAIDEVDVWKSTDPSVGDVLLLYLDNSAYNKGLNAELYDGNTALMQRVKLGASANFDSTLNAKPAYVKLSEYLTSYTFTLSRNV